MNKTVSLLAIALMISSLFNTSANAEESMTVNIKRLSMESALRIAQGAIQACRKKGIQVGVTVVDRGGHAQVVLRDVLAMDLTLRISQQKAYTAMAFNAPTSSLVGRFKTEGTIAKVNGIVFSAGGVPIQAGGMIVGGVGVSGAPSGLTDEECAAAGLKAVSADLEMEGM